MKAHKHFSSTTLITLLSPFWPNLGVGTPASDPSPRNRGLSSLGRSCAASRMVNGLTRTVTLMLDAPSLRPAAMVCAQGVGVTAMRLLSCCLSILVMLQVSAQSLSKQTDPVTCANNLSAAAGLAQTKPGSKISVKHPQRVAMGDPPRPPTLLSRRQCANSPSLCPLNNVVSDSIWPSTQSTMSTSSSMALYAGSNILSKSVGD